MAADAGNRKEQQQQRQQQRQQREERELEEQEQRQQQQEQRELEEIRRSFTDIGVRVGSLFEPSQHTDNDNSNSAGQPALAAPAAAVQVQPPAKDRPAWVLAVVVVVACLLAGGGLGYLLHRPPAGTTRSATSSIVPQVQTAPEPPARVVAPPACLQAAQRGDELIDLFTRNIRDRRLSLALKAYTMASQACRKEASP